MNTRYTADLTHLQRLFHKLPVDFIRGLNKVCSAMAVVAQHAAQANVPKRVLYPSLDAKRARTLTCANVWQEASKVPHALQISETVQDSTLASELVESAMAEMNGKSGVWRRLFCPVTGHRRVRHSVCVCGRGMSFWGGGVHSHIMRVQPSRPPPDHTHIRKTGNDSSARHPTSTAWWGAIPRSL